MPKVTKEGKSMIVSNFEKATLIEFIPAIGEEYKFWNSYLETNDYGIVTELKGNTVTLEYGYTGYLKFTLRNSGEWIEKGYQHYDRNRKLRREND